MNQLMMSAAQALRPLPAQVVRGWPQALVALPSATLALLEDRLTPQGVRQTALGVTVRAATPEEADHLAQQADGLLSSLGWRRAGARDGAERDGSCFHKGLRYEQAFDPQDALPQGVTLTIQGQPWQTTLLSRDMARPPIDRTALGDTAPRLAPGALRHSLRVRLPQGAAASITQAFHQGLPVTAEGLAFLVTALSQQAGALEALLQQTL